MNDQSTGVTSVEFWKTDRKTNSKFKSVDKITPYEFQ